MKLGKGVGLVAFGVVTLVGIVACQQSAEPSPTAATVVDDGLDSVFDEVRTTQSGGIKVDSLCSNSCTDNDREDNTIEPGTLTVAWIVDGTGTWCSTYHYGIYDKGKLVSTGNLEFSLECNPKLRRYYFYTPGQVGGSNSVTMQVDCNGVNAGSDSFRLIDNGVCYK